MQRVLETAIHEDPPAGGLQQHQPYLRLRSELNEQGRSVSHTLEAFQKGAIRVTGESPYAPFMREAEMAVDVPRRLLWQPHLVRVDTRQNIRHPELDQRVLEAFGHIKGIAGHCINLMEGEYDSAGMEYRVRVNRGSVDMLWINGSGETARERVGSSALAAAGLRLALAASLIDSSPPPEGHP